MTRAERILLALALLFAGAGIALAVLYAVADRFVAANLIQ